MQIKSPLHGKEINLTAGSTTIKSTNFSVDKNGNITAKGGTIGGFTLDSTKFATTIEGLYDFNTYDASNAVAIYFDYISTTFITSELYDIDGDREVDIMDAQAILDIVGKIRTNNKQISGTFQINSKDPKNFISVSNGSNLAVSIGVGGVNTHMLTAQNIVCGLSTSLSMDNGIRMNGSTGQIYAKGFNNSSLESIKKNITKFENALEIIKNSEIYEYNYKTEKDVERKHIGFVIGDVTENKYKTPKEVLSNNENGIESYSMSSIEWRALQQIIEKIENLESKIIVLEGK